MLQYHYGTGFSFEMIKYTFFNYLDQEKVHTHSVVLTIFTLVGQLVNLILMAL